MIDLSQAPLAGVTAVGDKLFAAIFEFSSNIDNNNSIQYLIYNYKRNNFYLFITDRSKKSGYRAGDEDTIRREERGQI